MLRWMFEKQRALGLTVEWFCAGLAFPKGLREKKVLPWAAQLVIDSLDGAVTQNEVDTFINSVMRIEKENPV